MKKNASGGSDSEEEVESKLIEGVGQDPEKRDQIVALAALVSLHIRWQQVLL